MTIALYNEIDPFAAHWLRNLRDAGLVAPGEVITEDIRRLTPMHLGHATQAHFFAGMGVWSYAFRLAGWPDDRPAWTGSCPCQPFSTAGRKKGFDDERHLWPAWFGLIRECRPPVIFGEQVAGPDGLEWLDIVCADLEGAGYAVAPFDLCAAGVGAPHIRQRLYFVAIADCGGLGPWPWEGGVAAIEPDGSSVSSLLGDASGEGGEGGGRDAGAVSRAQGESEGGRRGARDLADVFVAAGATRGFWRDADWIYCRDGKYRPVEPGSFPLAHGAAARVGRLRAYGNAIAAPLAATFVRCVMDILP